VVQWGMSSPPVLELDVRPFFERQRPPLPAILSAINRLQPGQALRLIAPFEPQPLYDLLAERGYRATPRLRDDDAWEILFEPE
jgi:uncharacterized protein (DUF2249 family)